MQTRKVNTYGRRSIAIVPAPTGIRSSLLSSPHLLAERSPSPDTPLTEISAGLIVLPNSPCTLTGPTSPVKSTRKNKPAIASQSKKENVNLDLSTLNISSPPAARRRKRKPLLVPSPKVKGSPKQSRIDKKIRASPSAPFRRIPLQRSNHANRALNKTQESTIDISDDEEYISPKKSSPTKPKPQATRSNPKPAAPRISDSVIVLSDDSVGPESHPPKTSSLQLPSNALSLQPLSRQDAMTGTPPFLRRRMSSSRPSGSTISRLSFGATANAPPALPPSPIIPSDDLPSPVDSDDEVAFLDAAAALESDSVLAAIQTKSEIDLAPRRALPPLPKPSGSGAKEPPVAPTSRPELKASKPGSSSGLKPVLASTKSAPLPSRPSILVVELPAPKRKPKTTARAKTTEEELVTEQPGTVKSTESRELKPTKQSSSRGKSRSPEKPATSFTSIPAPLPGPSTKPTSAKISTKATTKVRSHPQPVSAPYSQALLGLLRECSQSEPIDLGAFVATFSSDDVHIRFPCATTGPRRRWQKIGEASYSEVFRLGGVVVKIVPLKMEHDGWKGIDGPCVSEMADVQKEIAVTRAMGDIQAGFIKLAKVYVAFGSYPQELLDLWDAYDREFKSESIRPDSFLPSQMFVLLILPDGGPDLEHYTFTPRTSWRAAAGIFWQVARTLGLAESLVRFEHRDLHWGQILVQNLPQKGKSKGSKAKAHSNSMDSPEHSGVRVTLIDLGLSRMDTHTEQAWFTELEPEVFEGEGDYQFDVYRMMKAHCLENGSGEAGGWDDFRPLTNVMWLHYLARQLLRLKGLRKPEHVTSKYHTPDDVDAEALAFKCLIEVEQTLAASIVRAGGSAVSKAGGSVLMKAAKSATKPTPKLATAQHVVRWGAEKRWIQPACGTIDESRCA
ncbi:hypothetical protein RSOLAG1IB_05632 [Rhizoctonia solani AG-1 IB]|uniref:non-specific serine/threonine protein kinase n=1 Tax=Thanatephorus cucumeris (strain AG1-IB / isolate 7/3/14) TaxID=1108050 RepID=A0A0B7G5U2_THACB|nr:hypothetical protein RSOLAG1IB_05632 [Rhizoctonia solani AG-1 IB]